MKCTKFGCAGQELVHLKKGQTLQTSNGFLIAKISGWYCPHCMGSYAGKPLHQVRREILTKLQRKLRDDFDAPDGKMPPDFQGPG